MPSSQPSSEPSQSPTEKSCVPEDGDDAACTNASPTILQGSCIGGLACVNTDLLVQSIGIKSCVGELDPEQQVGVCQLLETISGESISIGDGSWYVYFYVVSFLVCTFLFQSLTY
jgi:hypothetical protein